MRAQTAMAADGVAVVAAAAAAAATARCTKRRAMAMQRRPWSSFRRKWPPARPSASGTCGGRRRCRRVTLILRDACDCRYANEPGSAPLRYTDRLAFNPRPEALPRCGICGGARTFEMQVGRRQGPRQGRRAQPDQSLCLRSFPTRVQVMPALLSVLAVGDPVHAPTPSYGRGAPELGRTRDEAWGEEGRRRNLDGRGTRPGGKRGDAGTWTNPVPFSCIEQFARRRGRDGVGHDYRVRLRQQLQPLGRGIDIRSRHRGARDRRRAARRVIPPAMTQALYFIQHTRL